MKQLFLIINFLFVQSFLFASIQDDESIKNDSSSTSQIINDQYNDEYKNNTSSNLQINSEEDFTPSYKTSRQGHPYNLTFLKDAAPEAQEYFQKKLTLQTYTLPNNMPEKTSDTPTISLSQYVRVIKDQGNLGACSGFAGTNAEEIRFTVQNPNTWAQLSPKFLYNNELLADGNLGNDVGSTLTRTVTEICSHGVCTEALDPYTDNIRYYKKKPTYQQYTNALNYKDTDVLTVLSLAQNRSHFISALSEKFPVLTGITVWSSFESDEMANTGIGTLPDMNNEENLGGHAVCIIGCGLISNQFGYYLENSWGIDWGMELPIFGNKKTRGFFWLPAQYIEDPNLGLASDFHIIKNVGKK